MSNFKCPNCKKVFASKQCLTYHTDRKVCQKVLRYICPKCNKELASRSSLCRHKKTCKVEVNGKPTDREQEIMRELQELKAENKKLMRKVNRIEKEPKTVINNNNYGNINTGTVNNIYLVAHGKEDIDTVCSEADIIQALRNGYMSPKALTELVHFNPKYPEFHNVFISNIKSKYAMTYDGKQWNISPKNALIDEMFNSKREYIEDAIADYKEHLLPSQHRGLIRLFEADDDDYRIKNMKEEMKMILYNKRDIPQETRRILDNIGSRIDFTDHVDHTEMDTSVTVVSTTKRIARRPGTKRKIAKVTRKKPLN